MTDPAVLVYCQHSLKMGHLVRSLAVAGALAQRFRVMVLNGGRFPKGIFVPPDVQVVNMPPLGVDETNQIVSHDGRTSVERALDCRKKMIRTCFDNLHPAIVLVEFFPFGRRKFASELLPLLQVARSEETRSLVVCSLRDILTGKKENQQKSDDRAAALANRYFDVVLVHSDPSFARFEESFHPTVNLEVPVIHTGFVVPRATPSSRFEMNRKRIVVSAGSGVAGEALLRMAIEAYSHFDDSQIEMKVIGGPFLPEDSWNRLRVLARGKPQLSLVRHVPNLCDELRNAAASVSQAGYNTCLDIVRAGVPALVVPITKGNEGEQYKRALRLQDLGAVRMLQEKDHSPARLAAEIQELMKFKVTTPKLDLTGAQTSARVIESMITSTRAKPKAAYAAETIYVH
jgi:predicted glycosyltransferase